MLKRFEIALGVLLMALTLGACQPDEPQQSNEGEAQVTVRGLSAYNITRMVVTAQPGNVSVTLDHAGNGAFSGRLLLPAGDYTLKAEGYSTYYVPDSGTSDGGSYDAGYSDGGYDSDAGYSDAGSPPPPPMDGGSSSSGTLVATGSATITIVAGGSTSVTLRIYDITPPPSQGDIGPFIRSVKSSKTEITTTGSTLLEVDAVDLDGDALSYSWFSSCPSGTFTNPFSASTGWSSSSPGVCKLSVKVSSRGLSVTETIEVTVFTAPTDGGPGEGTAVVNGEYIARPVINGIYVSGMMGGGSVYRYYTNATLPPVQAGATYYIEMQIDYGTAFGSFDNNLESDCGGSITRSYNGCSTGGYCNSSFNWTTPAAGSVCKLTSRAVNGTLADSFSVGVAVK
ncbi:MAG TPA: hypothetical protein VF794_37265 [Archangium sp.]|uniref:hypothetical protein n=1 Tax=Archangium sp. TaxID=1872627 RepID=UPI002EDB9527